MYRSGIVKLKTNARFSTICLHAGQEPDPSTGAIITPIYQTSTYVQEALGKHKGFEYGRTQNPTRLAVERNVAAIERGKAGFAFASGMAAMPDANANALLPLSIAAMFCSTARRVGFCVRPYSKPLCLPSASCT